MKKTAAFLFAFFLCSALLAQRQKVAVFLPLYLDSAYDAAGSFRFEKTAFPKYAIPGLEFFQGAQLALDSLEKRGAPLDVYFYDVKSLQGLNQQLAKPELKDVGLLIGQTNAQETAMLADWAARRKVPFVSATLPNDAGVDNNPYFVLLNTTLQSHVEGIYRFLQKYHSLDKIVVFRKPGSQEDQLKEQFTEMTRNTASGALSIRYVDLPSAFTSATLAPYLDSTRRTVCIAGSLEESFAGRLLQELRPFASVYPLRVIGMPTWDRLNLRSPELEIVYTSPFYFNQTSLLENRLATEFSATMATRPSDVFFRGYETVLRFSLLLLDTKKDLVSNLIRKGNTVFTPFDIAPVFKDKSTPTLDYFENKHLYFIKVQNGVRNVMQ